MSNDKSTVAIELVADDSKATANITKFAGKSEASFKRIVASSEAAVDRTSFTWERLGKGTWYKKFDAEAVTAFDKVEKSGVRAASRIESGWNKLKSAWVGIIAGIAAVAGAWELMNSAAKARQEEVAFANLAASYGVSGKQIVAQLKEVSRGTVDTLTLIRSAGTAMMMGIRPEETVNLMKIAMATTKQTGQTTVKAFEDITLAVGRQSKMILDNLGIIVNVEKANERYAQTVGKTAAALTDAEKKMAFMNETMVMGNELILRMGDQQATAAEKFQRFAARANDLKVFFGDVLIRAFNLIEMATYSMAAATWRPIQAFFKLLEASGWLTDSLHLSAGAAELWGKQADQAGKRAEELGQSSIQAAKDMVASNNVIVDGQRALKKTLEEVTKAQEEQEKSRKGILDQKKKEADEIAAAQAEMYAETGAMAEQHYAAEAQKLVQKVARWQKAGGEIITTENWLYDKIRGLGEEAAAQGEQASALAMYRMQGRHRLLVDEITGQNQIVNDVLVATGMRVEDLNGSSFLITANLDGTGFTNTVDGLIDKFRELAAASAAAGATAAATSAQQTTSRIQDGNVMMSSHGSSSGGSVDWDGGMYDSYQIAADGQTGRDGNAKSRAGSKTVTTINNFNQQISRSDVTAIISEQKRREGRR